MKKTKRMWRQGDVLIWAVGEVPRIDGGAKAGAELPREGGRVVLAHGELTGHAHAIADKAARLREQTNADEVALALGQRILTARGGVDLTHEEHGTIRLPRGTHVVRGQREYSPEELRRVVD